MLLQEKVNLWLPSASVDSSTDLQVSVGSMRPSSSRRGGRTACSVGSVFGSEPESPTREGQDKLSASHHLDSLKLLKRRQAPLTSGAPHVSELDVPPTKTQAISTMEGPKFAQDPTDDSEL